ncbi:hypothetical protein LIER_02927 [Lithospermum erythrorhizon]|uniref:Uncharacterized protein n=1 Tax=Lithospermum erythrorhizon TaxID=34254 RepID=A0AAV3NRY5_LITER
MDNIFQDYLVSLKSGFKLDQNLANTSRINHDNAMGFPATEIAFYDALKEPEDNSPPITFSSRSSIDSSESKSFVYSNQGSSYGGLESSPQHSPHGKVVSSTISKNVNFLVNDHLETRRNNQKIGAETTKVENHLPNDSSRKKKHQRDEEDATKDISIDEVAICSSPKASLNETMKISGLRRPQGGGNRRGMTTEVVDLRALLMQCAEAVARFDNIMADAVLRRIRQYSSPTGDAIERVAYYFANALEARMSGIGTAFYTSSGLKKPSAAEILKAHHTYVTTCPFKRMSNIYANKTIKNVTGEAATLHIIDFGVLYGYQWPCLIQTLSERPGGPPKLRIAAIDFPQPGFLPAERVEETGCRDSKRQTVDCRNYNTDISSHMAAQFSLTK